MASVAINVLDPEFYVDPWQAYRWLRDEAPVYWDPVQKLWVISRYDDVLDVEKDTGRYSSSAGSRPLVDQREDMSMINMDDPVHQQQRRLVFRRFTPRATRAHESRVRGIVTGILDAVAPLGQCEAIEAIASRLPAMMISDLLGYPRELWERVRYWSEQTMLLSGQTSPEGPPHEMHPGILPVVQEFAETTTGLILARRAEPRDDLISVWARTPGWDIRHILDETILVLDGGAETTRTVIGSMIRELALQPDQRRILTERPELLATTAVEEFIRWVSPILNMRRTATADHDRQCQRIRAGDEVLLLYGAANRDPRAFPGPDILDVTRPRNRHLAFGAGTHLCLGAHLARLEIRVLFEEMLRRMPDWELACLGEPRIVPSTFTRAYDQIRITFTPSRPSLRWSPVRLTVLGACGAWPEAGQACSGFLVEHEGFRLLIDAGYAIVPRLLARVAASQVDAVFISHGHPDHCADLNPLLRARALSDDPPPPLPVYALPGALDAVLALDRPGMLAGAYALHEFTAGDRLGIGPFDALTHLLPHWVPNAGVRLAAGGQVLAYTGDSGPDPAIAGLARGADLLLAEATYAGSVPTDAQAYLSSASQAGRQAARAGTGHLALTHLWPGTGHHDARAAAAAEYDGRISIATAGLSLELG